MEAALLELREAMQSRKTRFISFYNDVKIHSRQVVTDEEGTKGPLKRFHLAVQTLFSRCNDFSDTNDNQIVIADAVKAVRQGIVDLLALDPRLDWTAKNVVRACDSFLLVLAEKPVTKATKPLEQPNLNVKAYDALNLVDELSLRMSFLGDHLHGGIVERRPAVALIEQLRRKVQTSMFSPIDTAACVTLTRQIMEQLNLLGNVKSKVSGEPGFLSRVTPHVTSQCEAIIRKLGADVHVQPRGSLSIRP